MSRLFSWSLYGLHGATYQADSEQVIATVPIGYADGWTQDMQNFSVLVDG